MPDVLKKNLNVNDPRFNDVDGDEEDSEIPDFADLEEKITKAIEKLGGAVFVKTNWSAVLDTAWVFGSLKCQSVGEIFLLLQSSSLVNYDLDFAYENCENTSQKQPRTLQLVLKRWCDLLPSNEYRLFIINNELKVICQRNERHFFKHLQNEITKQTIKSKIKDFYTNQLHEFSLETYSVDIYIDKSDKIWIIDFNSFPEIIFNDKNEESDKSKSLKQTEPHSIVSWNDILTSIIENKLIFKIVSLKSDAENAIDKFSSHRVPIELVSGELNQTKVNELDKMLEKLQEITKKQ